MGKIRNINLNIDTRESFTIDGDENKVIKLDIHDTNIVTRLTDALEEIRKTHNSWTELNEIANKGENMTNEEMTEFSEKFKSIEAEMRNHLDYAFDCPGMCDTILGNTSIFSSVNGVLKYEQIIDSIITVYEDSIKAETAKLNKRTVAKKTEKYVK